MNIKKIRVLIIEDSKDDFELMLRELKKGSFEIIHKLVEDSDELLKALEQEWDVIISDYSLPGFTGYDALKICNEKGIDTPFIMVSGTVGEDIAVDMMKSGAKDYIMKNNLARLFPAIEREIAEAKIRRERKLAQKALIESEERFRHISSTISDIAYSCTIDKNGNNTISWITGAVERILGYTIPEMYEKKCWGKLVIEEDYHLFEKSVTGLTPGSSDVCELQLRHKNGDIIYIQSFAECVQKPGKPDCNYIYGGLVDITERKLTEKELKKSRELYRSIFANTGTATIIVDKNTTILNANEECYAVTGYAEEQLIGTSWTNYVAPESLEMMNKYNKLRLQNSKDAPNRYEANLVNAKGEIRSSILSISMIPYTEIMIVSMLDITERKKAEEEIQSQYTLLTSLINSPKDIIIFSLDKNYCYTTFNERHKQEMKKVWNTEIMIGMNLLDYMQIPELRKLAKQSIDRALRGEAFSEIQHQAREDIFYEFSWNPIIKNNQIIGTTVFMHDITDSKKSEELLRKSESLLSNAVEIAHLGPWEYDVVNDVFTFNDAFYKIFKTTAEKVGGYTMSSVEYGKRFVHPEDISMVGEEVRKAIESDDPNYSQQIEHRFIDDDGEIGYITVRYFVVKNESGKTIKTYGVNQDITEQKRAESTLRESERKFNSAFRYSPVSIMITAFPEGKFVDVNDTFLKETGYNLNEVIGQSIIELGLYENISEREKMLLEISKTGFVYGYEMNIRTKSGKILNCLISSDTISLGGKSCLLSTIIDITDRKKIEKKNQLLAHTVKSIAEIVTITDLQDRFTYVNKAFCETYGYTIKEIIGQHVKIIVSSNNPPGLLEDVLKQSKTGNWKGELLNLAKDGREFPISLQTSQIKNEKGKVLGLVGVSEDITNRKQAEEILKESESSLRYAQEIAEMGSWEWDMVTQKTSWSENYFAIHGLKHEEVEPSFEFFRNRIHPDDVHLLDVSYAYTMKNKTPDSFEVRIILPDGIIKWVQINIVPVIEDDKIVKLKGVIIDITKRKKAEENIINSQKLLQRIIDLLPVRIFWKDNNLIYLGCNEIFAKDAGKNSSEDLIGKDDFEMGWKEQAEIYRDDDASVIKSGIPKFNFEEPQTTPEGEKIWIKTNKVPLTDLQGNTVGILGSYEDITERKQSEELLKESESKYRNLIETMPEGFYRSTPEGYFVDVNPALVKMLGYNSKEELMKINIPEELYFSEEERNIGVKYNIDFIPDTEVYRLRKKDGSEIWIEDHARYISDSSGKILFHEGIMRDISESLLAQKAIIESKERAEESSRLKTSFLANMSHELRTPMVGILGFSEILKQECETEETRAMAENILTGGNRLMETLNLILDISRIEAGKLSLNYDYVDIIKVAKEVINTFDIQAKKVNLELKFESKEKSIVCRIDERLVRQIINNLVNNGIKYTEKGGVTVEISKEISDGRYYSIIKVKDTGLGIPEKFQKVIFEEFRQVSEGYGRSFEGTGLGLSIVEKFVKRLGGKISVESKLGSGSIFIVRIPVDPDEFSPKITNIIEKQETDIEDEETIPAERIKALCVDDDEGTLSIAREFLKGILDLELVYNGTDAINLAKKKEYSLILMDINLKSEIDGVETTKRIRKIKGYDKIPVIAVTAFAMKGDREKYLNSGFDFYLAKPFKREEIISVVKKAMKSISN